MKDDSNGSYAKMRAKLCAQSLMFNNRESYLGMYAVVLNFKLALR